MTELAVLLHGQTVVLGESGPFTIGRDAAANLRVNHRLVSRQHLIFTGGGALWSGCDLGAANGTYLGGKRIEAGSFFELRPGMELMLGNPVSGVSLRVIEAPRVGRARRAILDEPPVASSEWQPLRPHPDAHPKSGEEPRGDVIRVGRKADNDLVLDDSAVSGHHALVVDLGPGRLLVQDLRSTNGTYIDGVRVHCQEVGEGSIVSFGKSFFIATADGLESARPMVPESESEPASLSASQLSYRITDGSGPGREGKLLLDGVSFSVPPRSLLAVIGPSGAGKSTLLRAITGAIKPTSGQVLFSGLDMSVFAKSVAGRVGVVPQEDLVHRQLTARQALNYAAALRFPDDTSRAERAEAVNWAITELGLREHADIKVRSLSGGQRKRVSAAMELLTKPDLLLLDEPTSGLDPNLDREIMELLADLAHGTKHSPEGRTVVVVTHSTDNLDKADNVLLLAPGGRVAYFGPPAALTGYFGARQQDLSWAAIYSRLNSDPELVRDEFVASSLFRPAVEPVAAKRPARKLRSPRRRLLPQIATLLRRQTRLMLSDRYLVLFTIGLPVAVALLTLIVQASNGFLPASIIDDVGQPKSLLVIMTFGSVLMGLVPSVRQLVTERVIFAHEAGVGVRPGAYLLAKVLLLGLVVAMQSALLTSVILALNPHSENGIFTSLWVELFLASWATAWTCAGLGLFLSGLVRTVEQVMPLMVVLLMLQLVLGGGVLAVTSPGVNELSMLAPGRWGLAAGAASLDFNQNVTCRAEVLVKQTEDREVNKKAVEATDRANKEAADRAKDAGLPEPEAQTPEFRHTVVDCATVKDLDPLWDHTGRAWAIDLGALGGWFSVALIGTWAMLRRRLR